MGRRSSVYKLILLAFSAVLLLALPLSVSAEKDILPGDPAEGSVPQNDEGTPQYTLIVSYIKEGEETPFLINTHTHEPGFAYNIASPVVEGYRPDSLRLFGTLEEDTEVTVEYHVESYPLTIHYRFLNGESAAPDHRSEEVFGMEYRIPSPAVRDNVAVTPEVSDTMPGRGVEWTVFYVDRSAVINL